MYLLEALGLTVNSTGAGVEIAVDILAVVAFSKLLTSLVTRPFSVATFGVEGSKVKIKIALTD